jgi:alkylation response protein AidB-like acyl-CoA dehydrogenase
MGELVDGSPARPLDPLTPIHHLPAPPTGMTVIGGPEAVHRWNRDGALLVAAQAAGLAAAACAAAAAYALERQQFDRPIGSFQAVKHLLADMVTRAELANVAVEAAGVTVDQPSVGDADEAVHCAKVVAGGAAVANSRACVQIHGGMGYAWEVDAHLYLKRAWLLDQQFGTTNVHAHRLAGRIASGDHHSGG